MRLLAGILGGGLGVVLVIAGTGALFVWVYTVLSPDHSTSATDLYELGVWAAAIVGGIFGLVVVVGFNLWLGRKKLPTPHRLNVGCASARE